MARTSAMWLVIAMGLAMLVLPSAQDVLERGQSKIGRVREMEAQLASVAGEIGVTGVTRFEMEAQLASVTGVTTTKRGTVSNRVTNFKTRGQLVLQRDGQDAPGSSRVAADSGAHGDAAAMAALLQDLASLGNCGKSARGKRHRSLICSIARNDMHLREFLVRNLLVGFCHIVIYDDNRVGSGGGGGAGAGAGIDHNISELLDPFVREGLVTHVPTRNQHMTAVIKDHDKNVLVNECLDRYGTDADWATNMDTDEVIVFGDRDYSAGTTSVGMLNQFLTAVEESSSSPVCGLTMPWRMMYGQHKVLRADGYLMMDAFPTVVSHPPVSKALYRTDVAKPYIPHSLNCTAPGYSTMHKAPADNKDGFTLLYLHYYAKTVEEYIIKAEQSMPPYRRLLEDAYDCGACPPASKCMVDMKYDALYKSIVRNTIFELRALQGGLPDGGQLLAPPPETKPLETPDYGVYEFFKLRVAMRDEWDEREYLRKHPDVAAAVGLGERVAGLRGRKVRLVDGLHHFLLTGFNQSRTTCWKRKNSRSFCV